MTSARGLERIEEHLDELLADHSGRTRRVDLTQYKGRIVDFARDVLHITTLYPKQMRVLEAFADDAPETKQVVCIGGHGVGKDFLGGGICAPYSACVLEQLTILISATERQLLGQTWYELTRVFHGAPDLPGRLYATAWEIGGERRVQTMTASSTDALTGWHRERGVSIIVSESQAQQVEDHVFDALMPDTASAGSRILVLANPIRPQGRVFDVYHRPTWTKFSISVTEHPNVVENRIVIAGGPEPGWPDQVAAEFGRNSAYYQSRVLGDFPTTSAFDALVTRADIDRAFARFADAAFHARANNQRRRLAVDVARSVHGDATCIVTAKGPVVESIETIHEPDLMVTAKLLHQRALLHGAEMADSARPTEDDVFDLRARIVIDDSGLGGGCTDRLRELHARVTPFVGGAAAPRQPDRFANRRAEAYFGLRERLLRNTIAIVPDEKLAEELLATTFTQTANGRTIIVPKDEIRSRIGRSPDRADALSMAFEPSWTVTTSEVFQ